MTRLNSKIRNAIISNAIVKSGVTSRKEALITRRAKLADDVRLFAIGGAEKEKQLDAEFAKVKKQLEKLDSKFFKYTENPKPRRAYGIGVNFAGRSVRLFFNGGEQHEGKAIYKNYIIGNRTVIIADNPLNDEFDAIESEQRAVNDLRSHVKAEVTAMVNSVTTIKKLLEIWPEAKELLPPEEQVQSTALVANVDNLNTMIGLPSGDEQCQ